MMANTSAVCVLSSNAIRFVPDAKVFYRERDIDRLSSVNRSGQRNRNRIFFRCNCMLTIFGHWRKAKEFERHVCCICRLGLAAFSKQGLIWCGISNDLPQRFGGRLEAPKVIMEVSVGFKSSLAGPRQRQVRQRWNQCKSDVLRSWDKALFELEKQHRGSLSGTPKTSRRCTIVRRLKT